MADGAPSSNIFDQYAGDVAPAAPAPPAAMEPAAPSPEPVVQDNQPKPAGGLFDEYAEDVGDEKVSTFGAFARGAEKGVVPAAASLVGAGAGGAGAVAVGAMFGTTVGPWGTLAGAVAGGIAAGYGGSYLQNLALSHMPDSWKDPLGLDDRTARLDAAQHGTASFLGGLVPFAVTMTPTSAPAALPKNATAIQQIMAHPATSRVFGGAFNGGVQMAQDEISEGHIDWKRAAISTVFGVVFNRPNRVGEVITEAGGHPIRILGGQPHPEPPTVAQVGDLNIMGPGVTEEVFQGSQERAPTAAMTAHEHARVEQGEIGELPQPDLHTIARQMEPELFAQYDELQRQRDAFAAWHGEGPEHVTAEQHLADTETKLREMAPEVAAAYRRAEETIGPVVEEEPPFRSFAEMLAAHETGRTPDAQATQASPGGEPGVPPGGEAPASVAEPATAGGAVPPSPARSIGEQRAAIAQDVTESLIAAGRPEEEARAAGQLVAARYITRAGRFGGKLGTAEELFAREGAAIAGAEGRARLPRQVVRETETAGAQQAEAARAADRVAQARATEPDKPGLISQDFDTSNRIKNEWRKKSSFTEAEPFIAASWHNQRSLGAVGDKIAAAVGVDFKNPGIKALPTEDIGRISDEKKRKLAEMSRRRLETKAKKHGIGGVTDQVRAGFDVQTPAQADQVVAELAKHFPVVDEGWQTTMAGYFDRKAYVRFPDGMIGEIQIWPPGMFPVKDRAHGLYEGIRELPPWHPLVPSINKTANEVYAPVRAALSDEWKAVLGSGGSEPNRLPNAAAESTTASEASAALTSDHLPSSNAQASEGVQKTGTPSHEPDFTSDIFGVPAGNVGSHAAPVNSVIDMAEKISNLSPAQQKREVPQYTGNEAARGVDQPAGVFMFDPTALNVDAKRFQFKGGGDEYGVTGALRSVTKWDPLKAQSIIVWEQADGKLFVADGHQRAGLARRLSEKGGQKIELPGLLLREKDGVTAEKAKALAAATNIANGSGSALDGAKILRSHPELMDGSIPLSAGKGKQAVALARLGDEPFKMVVNEVVPEHYGAVVGDLIPNDAARQEAAMKAIARFEPKNVDEAAVLTQRVAQAELAKAEEGAQGSMFGDLETAESTAGEEMKIVGRAIADLKKDKSLFARVLRNASRIEETGSTIERESAKAATSDAEVFAKVLASDAYTAGPIRDELVAAARELKNGKATIGGATERLISALRRESKAVLAHGAGVERGAEPVREFAQKDEFDFEPGAEGKPQSLIPGVAPVSQRDLIQAAANKPITAKKPQKEAGGLFGDSMDQKELFQTARGKITISPNKRPIIRLLKDANASTFVHESGHQYLEELMRDAAHAEAPDVLKADAQTVRDWFGLKEGEEIKTKHHEKFARGFEQYVREGVAPSKELAGVFAKFRDWLLSIYQSLRGLGQEISPDIRNVFDRMLEMEPQRTVIAPDRAQPSLLHDIHEAEARTVEPHEAEPARDRIAAERQRYLAELPPEVSREFATQEEAIRAEDAAAGIVPAGETGAGPGGVRPLEPGGGAAGAKPASGAGGEKPGAVKPGGGAAGVESPAIPTVDLRAKLGDNPGTALAPGPRDLFGAESGYTDRAGNIRLDTLNTSEDVKQALRDSAAENNDFIGDRRGIVTPGQILDLANDIGMSGAEALVEQHVTGQAFNAEQVVALRKLLKQSAGNVSAAAKKAAASGSDEDLLAFAQAKERLRLVMKTVAGATAEAGRALAAFRMLPGETKAFDQMIAEATGTTMFQLKAEAKLAATLDDPAKLNKFIQNVDKRSIGGMILEAWINGLLSGPTTQVSNMLSNGIFFVQNFGPERALSAIIGAGLRAAGREGTYSRIGEVAAAARGALEGVSPAALAAGEAFKRGATGLLPGEEEAASGILQGILHDELLQRTVLDTQATIKDVQTGLFGLLRGVRDGILAGADLARAGGVEGSPFMSTKYDVQGQIPDIQVRGMNVLPVGTIIRSTGRMLATADTFQAAVNYSAALNAIAYRMASDEGLAGSSFSQRVAQLKNAPTPEMMKEARGEARQLTFMDKGGEFVRAINYLTSRSINIPVLGQTQILKFVAPFTNVVARILDQTIVQRTPIGAIFSKELQADLLGKNGNIAQDHAAARMLMGSAVMLAFGALAAEGYITGSGPKDPKKNAVWRLTHQPHSVKIGGSWYQVQKLGPLGMLMGMAADLHDIGHMISEKDYSEAGSHLFHAIVQNTLDQSSLQGPAELIKAVETPDQYGQQYIKSFLSSFVPASVNWIAKSRDPYIRQTNTVLDAIKARIPGESETLHPKIDLWGEPVPAREQLGGISSLYYQKVSQDPVNIAMAQLGMGKAAVEKKVRNVELDPEQYEYFARMSGRMAKMRLDVIVRSPQWETFPAYMKMKVINDTIDGSRTSAEGLLFAKWPSILAKARDDKLTLIRTGKKPK